MGRCTAFPCTFRGETVKLKNVWVTYSGANLPAIQDITLTIPSKKLVLITGPNGAGKTTLLETCLGLLKAFKGEVFLFGINTKSRSMVNVRKLCGYVPQDFIKPPFESYTVKRVIQFGLAPYKSIFEQLTKEEEDLVQEVAEILDIKNLLAEPVGTLSGGQQQKVVIARALVRRPRALFLDEPFSSLDKESRKLVSNVLKGYVKEEKATALIVSHDTNPVINLADAVIEMKDGRIVETQGL